MMPSYRTPIAIFVLLTMLLFHLGLKSGAKPADGEKIGASNDGIRPRDRAASTDSQRRFQQLSVAQSALASSRKDAEELRLKTEGIFVLRRTAEPAKSVDMPLYELLLFDLEGEGVRYPATSVGVPPEPAQSIRF